MTPDTPATEDQRIAEIRQVLAEWELGTFGKVLSRQAVAAALAAYDQALAGRNTWRAKALEMETDRDRLAAQVERVRSVCVEKMFETGECLDVVEVLAIKAALDGREPDSTPDWPAAQVRRVRELIDADDVDLFVMVDDVRAALDTPTQNREVRPAELVGEAGNAGRTSLHPEPSAPNVVQRATGEGA